MKNLEELTLQQQRFCDEYLVSFNAFRAALCAGYSESKARKADLLHEPKIQAYLKKGMEKTRERLEISHDRILRELAKVAFSNMGDYYDDRCALKPMYALTSDEKAALSYYQVCDAYDEEGNRRGEFGKIKLHNKMSALEKIARHTGFYQTQESRGKNQDRKEMAVAVEQEVVSGELRVAGFEGKVAVAVEQDVAVAVAVDEEVFLEQGVVSSELSVESFKEDVLVEEEVNTDSDVQVAGVAGGDVVGEKILTFPLVSNTGSENEVGKILTFSPSTNKVECGDEPINTGVVKPRHWLSFGS